MALRAVVTHRCSLVGSGLWHLEIIDGRSMETGSCGIVNTRGERRDELESASSAAAASASAVASPPQRGRREQVSLADPPTTTPQALGGAAENERTQSGPAATKNNPKTSEGRSGFIAPSEGF